MKARYQDISIYLLSILSLILFVYFSINYLKTKPLEIINFIDSDINENFEIEITNNLNNIKKYLKKFPFIESFLLQRNDNEINIQINLKQSFARNYLTQEVIFYDNIKAQFNYFKPKYLETIKLIDISKNSMHINNYLNENYQTLSSIFNIEKIEYIDDRRYNLVLSNGKIVMLPKVIDSKLLYFMESNIDLIDKNTNYNQFIDLRNFYNKTIILK
tara:strand:- start:3505 stop:4152 length:648 start_codon:yes stop_codon:yes gene_type:complete